MMSIGGFRVFIDNNLKRRKKYPGGKKDGNRLGRRKRMMMIEDMMVNENERVIYCSESCLERMKKDFGNEARS